MAKLREHILEANKAHTDLNIFAAVVALLEGGLVSSDSQPDDFKIIELAQKAQGRCLRRYDAAMARAGAPYPRSDKNGMGEK